MTQIQIFQTPGVTVECLIVDGDPWFKGVDVATSLGYLRPRNAVCDHVPHKFKKSRSQLTSASSVLKTPTLDPNDGKVMFISEAGLFKLVFKSKTKAADAFEDWVCSEVLPKIRKTGTYSFQGHYDISWKEGREMAIGREDALHYRIIEHIRNAYPDAVTTPGLGEHLQTSHQRMDSRLKGYIAGQPDIMVIRGLPNGNQDVFAIELKNPNGNGQLSAKQVKYHELLRSQCHVKTIVSSNYNEVTVSLQEHYQEVFPKAKLLAIADEEEHDFSTSSNLKYWIRKLKNKTALLKECDKRGIIIDNPMTTLNTKIVEALIATDSKEAPCTFVKNSF